MDKLQSPGRVTSPGEEKRRALAQALDAREERMNEIRRPVRGDKDMEEDDGGDAGACAGVGWLVEALGWIGCCTFTDACLTLPTPHPVQ